MADHRRRAPNPFDDDTVEESVNFRHSRASSRRDGSSRGDNTSRGEPSSHTNNKTINNAASHAPHDPLLDHYEHRLHEQVESDFFNDPSEFRALNRVIDILGADIIQQGKKKGGGFNNSNGGDALDIASIQLSYDQNPQYTHIKKQQRLVEEAIEHMAVRHCADLNSSVAAVGRMSRQFDEAKLRVRNLRRQVRDVKDSLRLVGLDGFVEGMVRCFVFSWGGELQLLCLSCSMADYSAALFVFVLINTC